MLPLTILLALPIAAGCNTELEPEPLGSNESAQTSGGNCSFIPGCKDLLEASDGAFSASVMTYDDALGKQRRRLAVSYREPIDSSFLLCRLFPSQPNASAVMVIGPEAARTSVNRPMSVSCPTSYGDNGGQSNSASFSIVEDEEPALWDMLFPPQADGARWYALQIAATNAHGQWDSRYGHNYRLVLRSR
jgi:hypothetical protein